MKNGKPKQMLVYNIYEFTPLGKDYGLLTGRFILKANDKMKERTGTFSLVFVHTDNGWKILHDLSGGLILYHRMQIVRIREWLSNSSKILAFTHEVE